MTDEHSEGHLIKYFGSFQIFITKKKSWYSSKNYAYIENSLFKYGIILKLEYSRSIILILNTVLLASFSGSVTSSLNFCHIRAFYQFGIKQQYCFRKLFAKSIISLIIPRSRRIISSCGLSAVFSFQKNIFSCASFFKLTSLMFQKNFLFSDALFLWRILFWRCSLRREKVVIPL